MTARTVGWTSFIAVAALALLAASRMAVLDPVENATLSVTSPVQSVMRDVTRPVADWINNVTDAGALSAENRRLLAENERLTNDLARVQEEAAQLRSLQTLAEVREQFPNDRFLSASVVSRDSSNMRALVAINRGRSDGIREGMIVLTEGQSLVGRVAKVSEGYAWVQLITDPKSAVSARVQESRAEGVVAGNYGGYLNMEFVGQGAAVNQGDFVITSGVGGGYPAGIVIGRVAKVEKTDQALFQSVHVDHLASLSRLEHVLVLTSFEPTPVDRP